MSNSIVQYKLHKRVAYITLNRADKRNALNPQMVSGLREAFKQAEDDKKCKVVVLQAKGDAFCSGADLAYLQQLQDNSFEENHQDSRQLMELFRQIYFLPKIVIGKIQGHALAGGCGLATLCDFSFAVPEAKFGYTEVKIGFIPAIVKVFLLRKIGEGKAKEILLTGDVFDAERALSLGLINRVVPAEQLDETVNEFAERICNETSGQSVAYTKQMIAEVQDMDLPTALQHAAYMNAKARGSEDCKKGISAFLKKEKISW